MNIDCKYYSEEFRTLFERYLYGIGQAGTARETAKAVRRICEFAEKDFLELMRSDVDSFFLDEIRVKKLKRQTVRSNLSRYVGLAAYIDQEISGFGMSKIFGSLKLPEYTSAMSSRKIVERHLLAEDFENLLRAAKEECDDRAVLLFKLANRAALSATEAASLKPSQVFKGPDGAVGLHLYTESYHSERTVFLDKDLGESLLEYMDRPKKKASAFIFVNKHGNPLTVKNLNDIMIKYRNLGKIGKPITFRDLRVSCVTEMMAQGSLESVRQRAGLRDARLWEYKIASKGIGGS